MPTPVVKNWFVSGSLGVPVLARGSGPANVPLPPHSRLLSRAAGHGPWRQAPWAQGRFPRQSGTQTRLWSGAPWAVGPLDPGPQAPGSSPWAQGPPGPWDLPLGPRARVPGPLGPLGPPLGPRPLGPRQARKIGETKGTEKLRKKTCIFCLFDFSRV